MKINFSLPIVCYMGHFLDEKNRNGWNYWISNIYSYENVYIGFREIIFEKDYVVERTYDSNRNKVSTSYTNQIEKDFIDIRINLEGQDIKLMMFYQLIDSMIVECTSSVIGKDILSTETLTCLLNDSDEDSWRNLFSHDTWYCFLKDSNHNKIGHRNINIYDDCSFIDTEFDNKLNSQYECLRLTSEKTLNEYGSLQRFIDYCKIYDVDKKLQYSKGGIILNDNLSVDYHKTMSKKLNIK